MASSDLNGVKDGMHHGRIPNISTKDSVSRLTYQGSIAKPSQKLIYRNNSSDSPENPSQSDLFLPLQLSSLGGSSRQAHNNYESNYKQHTNKKNINCSVKAVTSSCASANKAFPMRNPGKLGKYQGVRPKMFSLDARLLHSKKYAKATTGGDGAWCRQGSVCGGGSSREGSPNRGAQDIKSSSSQKKNVRKEIGNIPRNMLWMFDLSELGGLEIVAKLANSHYGFQNILKDRDRLRKWPDLLVLIVKLLAKVCDSDFRENKSYVLAQACHPEFLEQLADFMSDLPLHDYKNPFDVDDFLLNLLTFSKEVMNMLPYTASERFRKILLSVDTTIRGFELYQKMSIRDDVKELHHRLQLQLKETIAKTDERKLKVSSRSELLSLQAPPNDFHDINLIPTSEDIFSEKQAFVRPNLVHGAYTSVDHYLDVQFRLLYEDFFCPMRERIVEYVQKLESQKLQKGKQITNVRLYHKVMFLYPRVVTDRLGIVVNFDPERRLKKVQWGHSKRFMYGSLLCFTQDNFRNMIFATVVEREEKELLQGQFVVELCVGSQVRDDLYRTEYTMAESEVYFEPYFQVLKALKDMTEHEFPMRRYIVEAQREGEPPAYLMADPPVQYMIDGFSSPVLALDLWPSAEELGLDDSQYQAFRFALTKEFVVIQGPPGTGKTYLGLKVAGILLENHEVWRAQRHPILVVCYTNHALDQFLEGILQYTTRIVRVGGQSKCEKLNSYNLKEVRRNYKKEMYRNADNVDEEEIFTRMKNTNNLGRNVHARMKAMMHDIKMIQLDLELLEKNDGIISLHALYSLRVVNSGYYNSFRGQDKEEVFVEWLLSQKEYNDPNFIIHVTHDYNMASDENNIVNEEVDVIEEVTGRATRDMHEGYDLDMIDVQGKLTYADSLGMLMEKKRELEKQRTALIEEGMNNYEVLPLNMCLCEGRLSDAVHKLERLKQRLKEKRTPSQTEIQELLQQKDIWRLNFNDRWALYWHWIAQLRTQLLEKFQTLEEVFRTQAKQYEEVRHMIDLEVMRDSYVVGMTTTGAARLRTLLQVLKPRIVIVEEAAEVLESHIVVSLTNRCQHLILIGDHQQLRPSTSVYRLAKEYNLDVSLFERMLNNGMHCEVLKVQHRMRPEIARLIVPAIYPELLNHRSVTVFEEIHGVSKSLFFIDHSFPDEQVADSFSHKNVHEADFILALCRHLILQGYEPDTITVLATYTAQMFYMKKASKKYELLRNVRITVVDNFQGEESDIILLSLVRSNENANIGFLKIENRVCVALSRARKGMYVMGNMENLVESSEIWPKIKEVLIAQDSIGQHLELRCKVHPEQRRIVSKAEDFEAVPEGGCGLLCDTPLNCGHSCQAVCHPKDREHKEYKCRVQPCDREVCVLGHKCKKLCFEECGPCMTPVLRCLPCGHEIELQCHIDYEKYECQVLVEKKLPACKHQISLPCFKDPAESICKVQCSARLDDCGHTCRRKCHVEDDPDHLDYKCYQPCPRTNAGCSKNHACTKMCYEECGTCLMKVKKELPACGHKVEMPCSQDPITFLCGKKCERIMNCGHPCRKICSAICGGCAKLVTKKFPICQHEIKLKCCDTPTPDMCRHACERLLKCGHNCTSECGQTCTKQCMEMVKSGKKAACGHEVELPCYKLTSGVPPTAEELLSYCSVPCGAELKCEHVCAGTCSKCLQGRIHVPCDKACGKTLICGHRCDTPCAVTCPPCNKKCMLRCKHNWCQKKCGQPCTPCQMKCFWKCKHFSCTKLCYQPCNREPCYAPCEKILKCGHPCIGFCGEWCPPLCRICDEEKVKTVVFGFEDEEDARFVFLEDCKHTIESRALEKWLKTDDGEIKMCVCPLCKTVIKRNIRYSNIIKPRYAAVCEVKETQFGKLNLIEHSRNMLIEKLREIPGKVSGLETLAGIRRIHNKETFINILNESGHFKRLYDSILSAISFRSQKNRKNVLSSVDMETLGIQCEILCQVAAKAKKVEPNLDSHMKVKVQKQINLILQVVESRGRYISSQEADDLNLEVQRFHRIADMCVLESLPAFQRLTEGNKGIYEKHISGPLMSIVKYSMTVDDDVKIMLEKFAKVLKVGEISLEERKQIVKAIGMKQGHWFKCPNGHIYVITECGGAMQIGKCNECGARIGGTHHSLLSDNSLAPEMDGAQSAAWSEAANMANYRVGF